MPLLGKPTLGTTGSPVGLERPRAQDIWWLRPQALVAFGILPVFSLLYLLPHLLGQDATGVRFRVYFDRTAFILGVGFFCVLASTATLFHHLNVRLGPAVAGSQEGSVPRLPMAAIDVTALLTLFAYFLAFRGFVTSPGSVLAVFQGSGFSGHSLAPKIAGVTTLTQLGCVFITSALVWAWVYRVSLPKRVPVYFALIASLTVFRAFMWTERLALIEFVTPIVVVGAAYRVRPRTGFGQGVLGLFPLLAVGAALVVFAATEYFRSWVSHYQQASGLTFWEFVARRFLGYYYTSLNNGAGILALSDWPDWSFSSTAHWLRQFPFGVGTIFTHFVGDSEYFSFLVRYADPEFTNASGVFSAFGDLGIGGAAWYAAAWGAVLGYWYADFIKGRGLGVLMYPVAFVSLPESLRLLYLSNSRAFPILLGTAVLYLIVRTLHSRGEGSPFVGRRVVSSGRP